ncbi:hypothetical protein D9M70_570090 [compost metagenome]
MVVDVVPNQGVGTHQVGAGPSAKAAFVHAISIALFVVHARLTKKMRLITFPEVTLEITRLHIADGSLGSLSGGVLPAYNVRLSHLVSQQLLRHFVARHGR